MITDDQLDLLWTQMAAIYGHRWSSAMGQHDASGLWFEALKDIDATQLQRGLLACIERTDDWPPALPEFRRLCLGVPTPADAEEIVTRCLGAVRDDDRGRLGADDAKVLASVPYWDQRMLSERDLRARLTSAARAATPDAHARLGDDAQTTSAATFDLIGALKARERTR